MKKPVSLNKLGLLARWQRNSSLVSLILMLLTCLANQAEAQTRFTDTFVLISGRRGTSKITPTRYIANRETVAGSFKDFDGADLGEKAPFNRSTDNNGNNIQVDSLFINAEANTFTNPGDNIQSVQLLYRVYREDIGPGTGPADGGGQIPLNLPLQSGNPDGSAKWSYLTNKTNLVNSATATGKYVVEVAFEGTYTNSTTTPGTPSPKIIDDKKGFFYRATFNVVSYGNEYITLTWLPDKGSNDWFNANNWRSSNGLTNIPNSNTDVSIPFTSGGSYPVLDRTDGFPALVHNLTIVGRNNDTRLGARLSLTQGSLYIYGDFKDLNAGFVQSSNPDVSSLLFLAGQTQTFDASPTLRNLTVTGSGTKTITGIVTITDFLNFLPTSSSTTTNPLVLATRNGNPGVFALKLDPQANLQGETEVAYVLGTVTTTRPFERNTTNTFGNIGLDLKSDAAIGKLFVVRTSSIYTGTGTSSSISRGFELSPDNAAPVTLDLTFHYLNNSLNGIPAANLRLFSSETGDIPFVALGKTSADPDVTKTLTRTGFTSSLLNIFTLGNVANPLPVTLVSFTAAPTAQGTALLKWRTASESNNRGFGIERQLGSTDAWQSVGFVAAGSTKGSTYEFTDKSLVNTPASPQAYYRLRQEDIDGKVTYSRVAVINRTAAVASTTLTLSPVPVSDTNLSVGLAEAGQAGIVVAVTNTQGQRMLGLTTQASADAALSLPVATLAPGVYILTVQVPGQAVRHARFVKL